jgi:hypothetical protein
MSVNISIKSLHALLTFLNPVSRRSSRPRQSHWDCLTVFVGHPEVPLDNNTAERAQRGPVVGRKNYYGSGAV